MPYDTLWLKTTTTLQSTNIAQNAMLILNVPANGTYITKGAVPPDSNLRLCGKIEHITIHSATSAERIIDVAFFSGATATEAVGSADRYIDHESFVALDFWQVGGIGAKRAAKSGLDIPYQDRDKTKIFHMGLINRSATTIAAKCLVLEFSWRPDLGTP